MDMRYSRLDEGAQPTIMTALFLIRTVADIQSQTSSTKYPSKATDRTTDFRLWLLLRHAESGYEPGKGETMTQAVLGIIGGSGIYDLPGLENAREEAIRSPWGDPSARARLGDIAGLPV